MGAGCSNNPETSPEDDDMDFKIVKSSTKRDSVVPKRSSGSVYHNYEFLNIATMSTNLLMFTSIKNFNNDFTVIEGEKKEMTASNTFKLQGAVVGYYKGYKLDVHNQDKFFILVDGNVSIFCLIDGHGPYGEIVAQMAQDFIFKEITNIVFQNEFDQDYEKIITNIFERAHEAILRKEGQTYIDDYDAYLSGCAVTLVIRKDNFIYCANLGNVLALLFYAERIFSYKFKTKELTLNDSSFKAESTLSQFNNPESIIKLLHGNISSTNVIPTGNFIKANTMTTSSFASTNMNNKLITQPTFANDNQDKENLTSSVHKNFDINEELRRIYECGGEIRKLAGEEKSRIFVKGKYFPGLINTRSLGDQIGNSIGVLQTPHICKYPFQEKNNYYLIMCTDGISNVLKNEAIVGIIENNDVCKSIYKFIF